VVARNQTAATLSDDDRQVIQSALQQEGVEVGTTAGTNVDSAFVALQAAFTFGG
jgi:hypothetical protein